MRALDQRTTLTAMTRVCVCGCLRSFEPSRPWQKFFEPSCRKSNWENRWLRRKPAKGAQSAANASERISLRVYTRTRIQPGSIRTTLTQIAQLSPDFFLRLADELRNHKPSEAN